MGRAHARRKTGSGVYPVAVPTYEVQFVAQEKGFFKDEGYDFKLIQGGSGVKTREILASRQGDFAIADILHVLQLNKNGRPTRALNTVDQRAPGVRFVAQGSLRPGHRHGAEGRRLEAARRQAGDLRRVLARRHPCTRGRTISLRRLGPADKAGRLGRRPATSTPCWARSRPSRSTCLPSDPDFHDRARPRRTTGAGDLYRCRATA